MQNSNFSTNQRNVSQDKGGRIDLNNFVPDKSKKNDLKRRLYDSGISNIPMPSVKRPIEDNISSRPFSARMNSNKIQSQSPVKKRIQDLNTNLIKTMNESYQEAAMIEARNLGEGTAEFNRQQQLQFQSTVGGKLGTSAGGFIPAQIPRMSATMKGADSLTSSNKQLLMSKPAKPNNQIPPLDPETRQRMNQVLQQQDNSATKILQGPPAMIYAGFEGGMSLSQKNLEQARTKYLLDKLTGKLPPELKGGNAQILPPLNLNNNKDTPKKGTKSNKSFSTKSHAGEDTKEVKFVFGAEEEKPQGKKSAAHGQKWSDLDKYIELLLDSKSEEETVFVYLNPNPNQDPYDLLVTSYQGRNEQKYYTLSGKGLTLYENDTPIEFLSLGQWLIERDSYNHIKELSFFKKFKSWKFMRMWKKTIKHQNRMKAQNSLEEKLFMLQDNFSVHLMKHRALMLSMEELRFVDSSKTSDTKDIVTFTEGQKERRKMISESIVNYSERSRDNVFECISKVMTELRTRIVSEITLDEERKKNNPIQSSNTIVMKRKPSNNVFEKLGFPEGMTYGHRSSLRKECSRFLRFAYLVDFLSLESLANIYLGSVKDLIERLQVLDEQCDMNQVMTMDFDEALRQAAPPQRGSEPLFTVNLTLNDKQPIPGHEVKKVVCDDFILPPRGHSKEQDFDLLCHLELEPEKADKGEEEEPAGEGGAGATPAEIKYKSVVPNIQQYWLQMTPGAKDYSNSVIFCFNEGLECIQNFKRWSKHADLQPYADALEEWDDIVGDSWEEHDEEHLNPFSWIQENKLYMDHKDIVRDIIESAFDKVKQFLTRFQPLLEIYWRNKQADLSLLVNERLKNPAESLAYTIKLFNYYHTFFNSNLPSMTDIGLLQIDSKGCRSTLLPTPKDFISQIEALVPKVIRERTDVKKKWLRQCISNLSKKVENVDEFVEQTGHLNYVNEQFQNVRDMVDLYGQIYNTLAEFQLKVKKEDKDNFNESVVQISQLASIVSTVESSQESSMETQKRTLNELIPQLNNSIHSLHEESLDPAFLSGQSNMFEILKILDEKEARFKEMEKLAVKYNQYQEVLQTNPTVFEELDTLREDLSLRCVMWRSLKEWEELQEIWIKTQFNNIQAKEISGKADYYAKICLRLEKNLEDNPIQRKLKELVETFKGAMPIVVALRNEALQEHHWKEIKDLINSDFDITNPEFTLQSLIDLNAVQFQEDITAISTQASQEQSLRTMLQVLDETWKKVEFTVTTHTQGDALIITEVDVLYQALDEGLATINMVLGSRYVKPLRTEAEKWKKDLMILSSIVEEWVLCQKQWMYLVNIFTAADIKKQLPAEAHQFDQVDKFFKGIMAKIGKLPNAIRFYRTNGQVLDQLKNNNDILDSIQKKLEDYLENKRASFPRFYFLSNDELLEILAHSQELDIVQLHLKTCFDNLVKLEIQQDVDIVAMFSNEGERVPFSKPQKARGQVETWLDSIQNAMRETLFKLMKSGLNDYTTTDRKQWVLTHFGQIVATIAQIQWCSSSEFYINEMSNNPFSLQEWYDMNETQLAQLTELVRGKLTSLQRKIIVALVTTDVHARDIIEDLVKSNVQSIYDFAWQQQLRYYWDEEVDNCLVKQVSATLKYGYEYMGATSRLVITPLTDRCWITITGALHIKLGANPAGPAGTGKTESTKDLAKAIGILCIVFNCSDQVDYQMMGRLFSGLCQQGAWTCLDEFNRIDIEVLSVIAQQMLVIREALLRGDQRFMFEGQEIPLLPSIGVHITMNPGYAGRTELPDNLKVLFRPVAMMIPSYGLIAEIMLFAEGFGNTKTLSKKMVMLYKLSSEQLSQQDHYDFGMRAVKSVLVMAGTLKRANPSLNEDAVFIRAMRDSNVPKFLKDDLPLFAAIIQDLFPTVEITDPDYGELLTQIEDSIEFFKWQKHQIFILKTIQLFETFNVRFGVMLVGPTGAGKTTCYKVLEHTMTALKLKGSKDDRFQIVKKTIFNPKAITMGELYGEVNEISQEWHDGLASKMMRQAANEGGDDKSWIVFDGPVDALWIENMNTVLDDNMTLCLANGQRIKLRHQMRILFEVQDLAVASPATVSRCGMVYMTYEELGWRPFVKTWLWTFFSDEILSDNLREFIYSNFDATIDIGLEKIRESLFEPVKTVDIQQVVSICNYLEVMLDPAFGFKGTDDEKKKLFICAFAWSYIWGMGASLDDAGKERFDDVIREQFKGAQIPQAGLAYDYFYDMKKDKAFKPWSQKVPAFVYDKDVPYFELLVPTNDSVRHSYCLEMLLGREKPSFYTGLSGVGKSVIIQNSLQKFQEEKDIVPIFINFSAQTSSLRTQQAIEDKLEKKKRTLFGAQPGKKIAIFVDDINMPATETYGAQPPIELLRLFIDMKGLYDRDEWQWKDVEDTTLVAAAAPPGGGRSPITLRFTRHFNMFCVPNADKATLTKIFSSILQGFLKAGFQDTVQKLDGALVDATIEIYQRISEDLRPTPAKFHYLFNLRDVSKVFQGILMTKPISIQNPETMAKLWVNESQRVFYDRLINNEDKLWFTKLIIELLNRCFRINIEHDAIFVKDKIMFGDLLKLDAPIKLYEEIRDKNKMHKVLNGMLDDYNMSNSNKMNLVFFEDAIEHILRISRSLKQPRGNIMLIGVGGSGKQSLTKLASHMREIQFKQIEITKNFGPSQFKDFMKELMFTTGIDGKPICFLMTDTQIISETFIEDINNLLNTGEIPNLWLPEDKDKIINGVRPVVVEMKKVDTIETINQTFINRIRDNLHICLCMSPVGDTLRVRCRMFPSLVNCCTLDWFSRWPEEALLYVSSEFLKELELPSDEVRQALSEMCMRIHTSVEDTSDRFFGELRRRVYTTPKSYLDLINLYLNTLDVKRGEYNVNRNRLAIGLKKLNDTNKSIAELKIKLTELLPQIAQKNEELKVALVKVNADKAVANEKERVVSGEAEVVNKKASEAKAISDDAEADLAAAKPELEAAESALKALDKASIVEIKSFAKPSENVVMVMEACMILIGEKTDWNSVKSVLGNPGEFMQRLMTYDVSKTSEKILEKVRKQYLARPEFDPKIIEKASVAAKVICIWCNAVSKFQIVIKKVEPKKKKYEEVQSILATAQAELAQKMAEVNKVKDAVAKLEAECLAMQNEKERLEFEQDRCNKRMGRAEKLVVLLADEGVRWKETVENLGVEIEQLVGNVFLSCACISYTGAFTGVYRSQMVGKWVEQCLEKNIPTSQEFSLIKIMGDPVVIRGWNIASLPTDQVSIENGILATKAQRWALCIDPQQQANKWIKNMEKSNNLLLMKFGINNFLREISGGVRNGRPVLIEDIEEYIDPAIDPILLKQAFKTEGGLKQMRLGDSNVDYDDNFRFFMTTKMPNPHYLPEVCIKVTLINFTVTFQGLEEQLLGDVVIQEKPEIEQKRDEIVVSMDQDQRTLKNIENTILKLLSESTEEQILDEDTLITVLENSKKTSKEINERIAAAVIVEEEINNTRNQYRSVAIRGSILYFVIADLAGIDPMYQYSLGYIKRLFNTAIEKSKKSNVLEERLDILIDNITRMIYTNVSRGLFEAHKIIFSFLIITSINRNSRKVKEMHWNLLLRGAGPITPEELKARPECPDGKVITSNAWDLIYYSDLNDPEVYGGITKSIAQNWSTWEVWATCADPHTTPLPLEWNEKLNNFEKLIVLKVFRPEKLLFAFQNYVIDEMGKFFVESPSSTMDVIYQDTDVKTPLIFVLSAGADPTSSLIKFAKERNYAEKLMVISLGQGQGPKAEALIKASKKNGDWVMLQNCHLAKSWMNSLETIVINFSAEENEIHPDFRLYLTSMPADYFPVSVLQNGVKLTTEPPRGLRANLKRTYQNFTNPDVFLNDSKKPDAWKKLVFGLSFFHAILQERRKFGPLGWNIRYDFNDSDLETSLTMLRIFLDEQEEIPWDAMLYVTGQINYGGRVTDDWDRRCLITLLKKYSNPEILDDSYRFSESGIYYAPTNGLIDIYMNYIDELPLVENPEVFGLHENANITFQNQESQKILDTILSIQPRIGGSSGGKTPDEIVLERTKFLKKNLPPLIDRHEGKKDMFKQDKQGLIPSLSTVLLQEVQRFNKLLTIMRNTLVLLKKAIKGFIVMSEELDAMYSSFTNGRVPKNWEKVAYPSLKPLTSWYQDLILRVEFMNNWLVNGQPTAFWMSGFFFPQGFLTGCLQTHARNYKIAIDKLAFSFQIMPEEEPSEIEESPEDGVYIYGLYMDGARWDRDNTIVADQNPSEMYSRMPLIWFKPVEDYKPDPEEYSCPVYKTSVRAGMLSTTGQSTNFIITVEMPTKELPRVWILKAAALLCQLNE